MTSLLDPLQLYINLFNAGNLCTSSAILFTWLCCIGCWLWTGHFSVIFLTELFDNWITICSVHVLLVLSWLHNLSALVADFLQVFVPVIRSLRCLLTRVLIVSCQWHMCHWCYFLCIILVYWLQTLNKPFTSFFVFWHSVLIGHWFALSQQHLV